MNGVVVRQLIAKDWSLARRVFFSYAAGVLACLMLASVPSGKALYAAAILLITIIIGSGIHFILEFVIDEGSRNTLSFIMSLPVTRTEYRFSKATSVTTIFGSLWLVIVVTSIGTIAIMPAIPNGIIPFVLLVSLSLLAGFSAMLATALRTGAMAWTILVMVVNNVLVNFYIPIISHLPGMQELMKGNTIRFSDTMIWIGVIQIVVVISLLAIGATGPSRWVLKR